MKKLILIIAIVFSGVLTVNAQEKTFDLTVNISGLNSDKGTLMVGLYNKKENFLNKQFKGDLVKILGRGKIDAPIIITAHKFSASAEKLIEKAGGKITKI